jgi:hypothetical protein
METKYQQTEEDLRNQNAALKRRLGKESRQMRDNNQSLIMIKQRSDLDKADQFAALKRIEVSVRQIVKEYNIIKGRLSSDLGNHDVTKIDKVID